MQRKGAVGKALVNQLWKSDMVIFNFTTYIYIDNVAQGEQSVFIFLWSAKLDGSERNRSRLTDNDTDHD